ncbi:spore photoproduct lyase [Orenia metallireducens]|uniref:Spore photoproduct lyase n=1 Tax=Orenia metallireducens TaxID=1413210 RepID=A0A1C0A877_9FIRM|nr:spore photoproduct lyase [Orenia metallireducens]OCL26432.1 spore photoproduct lyase [Orenia metallireducens]
MKEFVPKRVFIEEGALQYTLAKELDNKFKNQGIPVEYIESHNRLNPKEEMSPTALFNWTKETLVVGVKKTLKFQSCHPSADYRVVTNTSCPAKCEYCYLAKNLGSASYLRIYVNIDEILEAVKKHIDKGEGKLVTFEASSSSDPLAVEHLTGNLQKMIEFFSKEEKGRLRVVTKFAFVDKLLDLDHNNHTKFRFSINSNYVIDSFEHLTANLKERITAANKIQQAGYPLGFIIAPLMIYEGWKDDYKKMLFNLSKTLKSPKDKNLSFELIMHRFTTKSKKLIESRFPNTKLTLDKEQYHHKGFGKYVYPPDEAEEMKIFMEDNIKELFPQAKIEYFT